MNETNSNGGAESKLGPAIGIIIVIIVLVVGALYFWGQKISNESPPTTERSPATNTATSVDSAVQNLNTQSSSDELNAINNDLKSTTLNGLDTELKNDPALK